MHSKSWRILIPVLAVVLAACGGTAKKEEGGLSVKIAGLNTSAVMVDVHLYNATADIWGHAVWNGTSWTSQLNNLVPGTYQIHGYGYAQDELPPVGVVGAAAKYETRGIDPTVVIVAGMNPAVQLVLNELPTSTSKNAPMISLVSITPSLLVPGGFDISAAAFDADSDLFSYSFDDNFAGGTFVPPDGFFQFPGSEGFASTYSPSATPPPTANISLSIADLGGNMSTVTIAVGVVQTVGSLPVEFFINDAPKVTAPLYVVNGQPAPGAETMFITEWYDLDPQAFTVAWSSTCIDEGGASIPAGVFGVQSDATSDGLPASSTNPIISTVTYTAPASVPVAFCDATAVVTDAGGGVVSQTLKISVIDPVIFQ